MAVLNRNPWGDQDNSFEQIGQAVAKPLKKAAGDTVKAVATDIKQQVTGDYGQAVEQTQQTPQAKQVQQAQQAQLAQTRQNLEQINQAIKKVRQEKAKQVQQTQSSDAKTKADKQAIEVKKKEKPVWKKMLSGKTGSKEAHQRTAG